METSASEKMIASASVDLAEKTARIEKLSSGGPGQTTIRISAVGKGKSQAGTLTLSEEQLIDLLYKAIQAGVVSPGFIGNLREKFEI